MWGLLDQSGCMFGGAAHAMYVVASARRDSGRGGPLMVKVVRKRWCPSLVTLAPMSASASGAPAGSSAVTTAAPGPLHIRCAAPGAR